MRAAVRPLAMRGAAVLVAAVLLAPLAGPARAQVDSREGIALQNQILELRRDLQALQAQRGGGYAPAPVQRGGGGGGGGEIAAQLLDRVQALEDEVRRLRGRLDELANTTKRGTDDLAKQIGDLNFKLGQGGNAAPAPAPGPAVQAPAPAAPAQASGPPARRPPELAMQEGNAALARRDYPAAEAAAREVLAGRGPRAADAQFLLAQALSGRRDFQGAAIAYDDAYTRARTGPRAPNALVGVASSMLALNEGAAACASLDKLRAEFPAARPDVKASAAALRTRAGCR